MLDLFDYEQDDAMWPDCQMPGCLRPDIMQGFCSDHYWQFLRELAGLELEIKDFLTNSPYVGFAAYCREQGVS